MPNKFFRALFILILLGCGQLSYAQQPLAPTRLYRQADGSFTTTVVRPQLSDKIVTTRPMIIRAHYYSKSSAPSILILNLVDDVNNLNIRYPVALIDKNSEGDVILYGPQLYDGRKELRVIPEILVLKSDQFAKYKDLFTKYFGTAAGLVPVFNQASKFIDLGWKTAEDFFGKDKVEKFTPIFVSRDSQQPLGTFPSWYVLANKDADPAIQALAKTPGFRDTSGGDEGPGLPTGSLQGGRVIFISIMPSDRAITLDEISQRIDAFFGAAKERLDRSKLASNNPFAGETVQANLSIRRNLETFLSTIELTRTIADNAGTAGSTATTEDAISTLFANFKAGQQQAPGTPFTKLKPSDDQQVAGVLTRLFEFKDIGGATLTGDFEEPGLRNIMAWSNWLDRRTDVEGKKTQTITFNKIQGFVNGEPTNGAYAVANPNFAIKTVTDLLPTATPAASATMQERLEAMKVNIGELRKVKDIFNSTDTNPWMRYEQRAVAKWLVSHLRDKDGNPISLSNTDFKSDDDVKAFADKLEGFLAAAKVFEPIDLAHNVWRVRPIADFVNEKFKIELLTIANDQQRQNKNDAIIELYRKVVEPSLDYMNKDERNALAASLADRFPKDIEGKSLSVDAPKSYFDNTIITVAVNPGSTSPTISTAGDANSMLQKVAFTQSTVATNTSDLSSKLSVTKAALNQQRKNALAAVFNLVRTNNIDFSTAMRGVDYINRVVATNPAPTEPTNRTDLATWISQMTSPILNAQWNEVNARFIPTGAGGEVDPDVQHIKDLLDNGCTRTSAASMSGCVEPSGDGMTGKELIQKLYDIICDLKNNSTPKRAQAEDILKGYIDVPAAVLDSTSDKCSLYEDKYAVSKLEWNKGMYRLKPPPATPQ